MNLNIEYEGYLVKTVPCKTLDKYKMSHNYHRYQVFKDGGLVHESWHTYVTPRSALEAGMQAVDDELEVRAWAATKELSE